jgi:hypothetical protein
MRKSLVGRSEDRVQSLVNSKGYGENLQVGYFYEPPSQQMIEAIQARSKKRNLGCILSKPD